MVGYYGDLTMTMQTRRFSEQIYGEGVCGYSVVQMTALREVLDARVLDSVYSGLPLLAGKSGKSDDGY